jgi:hypothetical protein
MMLTDLFISFSHAKLQLSWNSYISMQNGCALGGKFHIEGFTSHENQWRL